MVADQYTPVCLGTLQHDPRGPPGIARGRGPQGCLEEPSHDVPVHGSGGEAPHHGASADRLVQLHRQQFALTPRVGAGDRLALGPTVSPGMLTPLVVFYGSMPSRQTARRDPEVRTCPLPETC